MVIGNSVYNMIHDSVTEDINFKLYEIVKDSVSLALRHKTSRKMDEFTRRPYLILIYLYK